MNPLRILVLVFLFYLLYRLLTKGGQKEGRVSAGGRKNQPLSHDVLVEDPECHVYIPRGQAVTLLDKGTTHYFCSDTCRQKYAEKLKNDP